ncbi:MAG: hypothetical protein GKR90_13405 [Pseudomonadales bacterium]|nr:hypothetical protein [Pseudomonadales bacterium]
MASRLRWLARPSSATKKTGNEADVTRAKEVETQDKKQLDDREGELQEATREKSDAEKDVNGKRSAAEQADQDRRRLHADQSRLFAEFQTSVNQLKEAESQLTRAKSRSARAAAAKDDAGLSTATAEINRLEREITRLDGQVEAQRGPLLLMDRQYKQAVDRQKQAESDLADAEENLREMNTAFWDKVRFVKSSQDKVRESLEARLSAEREVRKTDDEIKRQNEKVKQAQSDQAKAADEDSEVVATQKEIDSQTEAKNKGEQDKNKATNKLAALKIKKEEWDKRKSKADDDLTKARDERDKAKDDLQKFLVNQFNNVRHKVTIDLTIMDISSAAKAAAEAAGEPPPDEDKWRTADEPRLVTVTIEYRSAGGSTVVRGAGGRTPQINGAFDDDLSAPSDVPAAAAICQLSVGYISEPVPTLSMGVIKRDTDVGEKGLEPKTVALYFDKGRALYDYWPPVPRPKSAGSGSPSPTSNSGNPGAPPSAPDNANAGPAGDGDAGADVEEKDEEKILVHAATPFVTGATDIDEIAAQCTLGNATAIAIGGQESAGMESESVPQMCEAGGSTGGEIEDVPHAKWDTKTYTSGVEMKTTINVPKVKPDQCEGDVDFQVEYLDSTRQWNDTKSQNHIYKRHAGLLGDAPQEYGDFGKQNKVQLRFQVFEGGHQGKSKQTVEWRLGGVQPAVDKSKYGLGALGVTELTGPKALETDASGYSKVDFLLEERWGTATATAEWKRGTTVCATATMKITRPVSLNEIHIGFAPKNGWEQGKEAFGGNFNFDALADALEGDGPETSSSMAVGLLDDWMDPVDEKKILFSLISPDEANIDPSEVSTSVYGLAWSFATDVPEESEVKFQAEVDEALKPVTTPALLTGEQSTSTLDQFQIGPEGKRLTIKTDEPFVPGQAFSGTAKLVLSAGELNIPLKFKQLQLETEGVVVDEDGIATEGSVNWSVSSTGQASWPFKVEAFDFEFRLEKLGLSAGSDAKITGKVKVPRRENTFVNFDAIIGPKGFIGRVSDFPEIELAKLKLERGAAFVVDMHSEEDPDDLDLKGNWRGKGLVVVQASLLLPEALKGDAETPPKISVKNLFYNSTGLNGGIDIAYTVSAKLGKVDFAIEKVAVEFQANQLHKGEFSGKMTLAEPFHGNVSATMSLDRAGKYSFAIGTDKPITAPSLGLTLLLEKVAAEYDQPAKIFTFELEAQMRSKTFSEIRVNKFKVKSTGDIEADVDLNLDMEFGKGFSAHIGKFALKKTDTEFEMKLETIKLQLSDALKGDIEVIQIGKGPKIEKFSATVKANKGPVTFDASVDYEADVFNGKLAVKVEKVLEIDGSFVLGTQKQEDESEFTYWYVELNSKVTIPLGPPPPPPSATGLAITKLGGGIGYNYDPPIGQAPGAVRKTDTFSLKAAIEIGNFPGGEVFAGRLTMVLVSDRFSVNGKVWVLDRESSLFGEGQLDLYWKPSAKLEGFVRMLIALPGTDGKLLRLNGQVDFKYAGGTDWFIKSRTLEGALLEKVIAEGNIDIKSGSALLEGNVRYDLDKSIPLAVVTLQVKVNLRADGKLEFIVSESEVSLTTELRFRGNVDVTLETRVRNFDLATVSADAQLKFNATNRTIKVDGSVTVSWDTWVHAGSHDVDIGYSR